MNTLDLVKENKVMLAIVNKAYENGFDILGSTNHEVVVKSGCLPVKITWEMCSCHGGRMWFSQKNTNIHIELSSQEYDEANGITDPETELAYYIDNKMVDTILGFSKYVYVVEKIGEYGGKDEIKRSYFNSVEKASRFVFDEYGHDLNSEYGVVEHQYPNPDMRLRVTYTSESNGVLCFKGEHLSKKDGVFKTDREYEIKFSVFRKR